MNHEILIENFVNNRNETSVQQLGELLIQRELLLVDFIEAIGNYLQSTELAKRSIALTLVANVLQNLPNHFLTSDEIHHLLVFTSAKMGDHHMLCQPAVDLYRSLAQQSAMTDEDCLMMIKSIFSDVYVQSFPQASRYNVYVVFLHFLLNRLNAIREIGSDFVCNFIQSMDGERDPRNLVLCFQCLQYMTKNLDIEPYKEELFEVVACYFPMEYKPKTTNTENEETITHEQLVLSLRNVLTSTGKFAQYCIPMLIEKLESDIPTARLSAMDVFIHCINEYDARDISTYLVQLWHLFSKQALCAESQEIETMALRAITALLKLIGKSIQNDETEISTKKFVDRAIRECEKYLKGLEMKLLWPATKVLQAIARANSTCAGMIWSNIIPLLTKQFENLEQVTHQKTILEMISYFLQPTGIRTIVKFPSGVSDELWILISTHFERFPSHCLPIIHHLLQLNSIPGQVLEDNLTKFIFQSTMHESDRIKLSTVLKLLASSALFERTATNLLSNLIQPWSVTKTVPSKEVLECCIDLCQNSERCQERLERFFVPSEQFIRVLPDLFQYLPPVYVLINLFTPLLDLLLDAIVHDQSAKIFVSKCGGIADGSCKTFVENFIDDSIWENDQEKKLFVTIYFTANLKRKIFQNELKSFFDRIHEKLFEKIFHTSHSNEIFSYFYGNLINKLSSKDEIMTRVQSILQQCQSSPDQIHIQLWTILVKSLILTRPSFIEQYLPTLMSWMNNKDHLADFGCQSLKILTNFDEQSLLLSSQADCIVHPMVKQIVFMNILTQMKPLLTNNEFSIDQMAVLVDLLSHMPKSLIQTEIISLLPILIRALSSSNESVWSSSLHSICDLVKSNPNAIADHLDTLLPRLTNLATYQKDMSIRITSLKCLQHLTQLPIHQIQPHRRHVMHVLKTCVDDHKRLVRKQAVDTQMSWCLLNA